MDSCAALSDKNKKEPALQACRAAIYAVDSSPESRVEFQNLRSEVPLKSYKLLREPGRREEAQETLPGRLKERRLPGRDLPRPESSLKRTVGGEFRLLSFV